MTPGIFFSKFSNIQTSKLLRFGVLMSGFGVVGGVLGYVFQVLMGRLLSSRDFALFGAIMGASMFAMAPMGALMMLVSKKVATLVALKSQDRLRSVYQQTCLFLFRASLALLFFIFLGYQELQLFFKIDGPWPLVFVISVVLLAGMQTVNNAFFQGQEKFNHLGLFGLMGISLKIALCVLLLSLGFELYGVLSGVLISTALVWFFGVLSIRRSFVGSKQYKDKFFDHGDQFKIMLPTLVANIAFVAMTQLDIVLVNYYFEPSLAAEYTAASVLGKAVLYLPWGLVMALFPMVTQQHATSRSSSHLLVQAASATLLLCSAAAVFYWLLGPFIVNLFYGNRFVLAGDLLGMYGFAILPMALVMVAEHFLIAKGRVLFAWLFFLIAPVQLLAIHLYHPDLESVIAMIAAGGSLLCLTGYCILLGEYFRDRS
jgi:O-antigen/teichoic acid export membrane protein